MAYVGHFLKGRFVNVDVLYKSRFRPGTVKKKKKQNSSTLGSPAERRMFDFCRRMHIFFVDCFSIVSG